MSPRARSRLVRGATPLIVTLVAGTALAAASVNVSARIARFAVSQEAVPVEEAPAPFPVDDNGYDNETQQRRDAEQHLEGLRRHFEDRERELQQNFREVNFDLGEIRSAIARWKEGIEALSSVLSSGSVEDFWDFNADFYEEYQLPVDEAFQRAYDAQVFPQIEKDLKNSERQLKDMKHELKRFQKDLKGALELSQLEEFVRTYEENLTALKVQFASLDRSDPEIARDFQSDLHDALSTQDFYDIAETLHEAANAVQVKREAKRQIKQIARSIKDQERQVKRLKKYGSTAELENILAERKALLTEIEDLLKQNPFDVDAYLDASQDMADLDQQAGELLNELGEQENLIRQEKNVKRTLREKERNLKEMKRECKRAKCQGASAEELIKELQAILGAMKESAAAQDYDGFWSLNSDADDLAQRFWEEISGSQNVRNAEVNVKELKRSIKEIAERIRQALTEGKIGKEQAAVCQDLIEQVRGIAGKMEVAQGDDEKLEALQKKLGAIGEEFNAKCSSLLEE